MINWNRDDLFKLWIDYLKTNPPKARGTLQDFHRPDHRCCLGHACFVAGIEPEVKIIQYMENRFTFAKESSLLPICLCRALNITQGGTISSAGLRLVHIYLRENNLRWINRASASLTNLNDWTSLNHAQMGEIVEILYKNDAFVKYENY